MKDALKIAVVGLGRIGKVHGEILQKEIKDASVKYAVDIYLDDEHRKWAESVGIENVLDDPAPAFADPEVGAVYICSSTNTHSEYIARAARAGKHIFCEKPLDSDLARLDLALREVEKSRVLFQTGFMRRFDRNHSYAQKVVASGKIGAPQLIKLTDRDALISPYEYLKISGGIFFDMMVHDFDLVRFLSGSEVEDVYATGGVFVDERLKDIPDVDAAVVVLRLASGAVAVVDGARQAFYGHDQRSEILCAKGTIQAMNENENTVVLSDAAGIHGPKPLDFFIARYFPAYVEQARNFVLSVRENRTPPVSANDGIQAIRIARAAQMSLVQRRIVGMTEVPAK